MAVSSITATITPTITETVVATLAGGPLDRVSVFVAGGQSALGDGKLVYRFYSLVAGLTTLIAECNTIGSATPTTLEWQDVGAGGASSVFVEAGGSSYILTVQALPVAPTGSQVRAPVTATVAGVNVFDASGSSGPPIPPPPFNPAQLVGLEAWYRADLGVTLTGGTVSGWADQSGTGDPNKNLAQATALNRPTLVTADASLGLEPSIATNGTEWLQTGTWLSALPQPCTLLLVGYSTINAGDAVMIDGINATDRFVVYQTSVASEVVAMFSHTEPSGDMNSAVNATVPFVAVCVFNGPGSRLYVNKKSAPVTGDMGTTGLVGLTVAASYLGAVGLTGRVAEVAGWNSALSTSDVARVLDYAGTRYGIVIAP